MAVQTIDKALFDAYFDQILIEKRAYFKELVREIIEEKLTNVKSNKDAPILNVMVQELVDTTVPSTTVTPKEYDPFAREQLMQHFEKILKEDHNLLLRLAQ